MKLLSIQCIVGKLTEKVDKIDVVKIVNKQKFKK